MKEKKRFPLVQLLEFDKYQAYGLYDGGVNSFVSLSNIELKAVKKWMLIEKDKDSLSLEEMNIIQRLKKIGFLKEGIRNRIIDKSNENINSVINFSKERASTRKLTLEVTNKCNLRCKYCRYTINELKGTGKNHASKVMDEKIYKKAIKTFIEDYCRSILKLPIELQTDYLKKNPPTIGLYGGEVLMYKNTVIDIVNFIKRLSLPFEKKYICIAITTNGTLLDEDFIKFCIKENIHLQISIDGPKSEHDKNRIFASGEGSFKKVEKGINILRHQYPNYYMSNVSFQAVQAPNYNQEKVLDFFSSMTINGNFAGVNNFRFLEFADYYASPTGFKSENDYSEIYDMDIVDNIIKIIQKYESYYKDETSLIQAYQLNVSLKEILIKVYETLTKVYENPQKNDNFFNSCYLLKANTYVSSEGEIHICERSDFSAPVGSVESGVNEEKIFNLYKDFFKIMNSRKCRECWAAFLCPICIAQLIEDGKINHPDNNKCYVMKRNSRILIEILFILSYKYPRTYNAIQEMFSISTNNSLDEFITEYVQIS